MLVCMQRLKGLPTIVHQLQLQLFMWIRQQLHGHGLRAAIRCWFSFDQCQERRGQGRGREVIQQEINVEVVCSMACQFTLQGIQ